MSERDAKRLLISSSPLVVIEAPAGCGKTHMAAEYAKWLVSTLPKGQVLILTHTHAACDVFRARTRGAMARVQVNTFDALISQICSIYHIALGLPPDVTSWAKTQQDGFEQLGSRALALILASPTVLHTLSLRYPVVLCDEHQDSSEFQNAIVMELLGAGSKVRIFADPMQSIFGGSKDKSAKHKKQWEVLKNRSDGFEKLDHPHRWDTGSPELGAWILEARSTLESGGAIDLSRKRPSSLHIVVAENTSLQPGGYSLITEYATPLRKVVKVREPLMILSAHNTLVKGVNAFLGRQVPIWEGHTRDALSELADRCKQGSGDPVVIADAFCQFVQGVGSGFSNSAFAKRFIKEVEEACVNISVGKPQKLQEIAKCILRNPTHVGVADALKTLDGFRKNDQAFAGICIDHKREFWEAVSLSEYPDPITGLAEITRRRSMSHRPMPPKIISTVHKAKGLESDHVIVIPCDKDTYSNKDEKRCLLYVAISRAKCSLTIVVSKQKLSPLIVGI